MSVALAFHLGAGRNIGSTDVAGTTAYLDHQPRPLLQVTLHSNLLNAADLGPLIGVTTKAAETTAAPTRRGAVAGLGRRRAVRGLLRRPRLR